MSKKRLTLTDEQRFQVLLAELDERYDAWHQMRSRSMQFTLWILGLGVAGSWKLLQDPCGHLLQRQAATILVILLGVGATHFLRSLSRGIAKNREALINIETVLELHDQNIFLNGKSILPSEYKDLKPRKSSHFGTLYVLLIGTLIYLLVAIWLPSDPLSKKECFPVKGSSIENKSSETQPIFKKEFAK